MSLYINKIRILSSKRKVTLKKLAKEIGLSETGFSQMLSNNTMKISTLQAIADYFKVPITWFFEESTGPAPRVDVDRVFDVLKDMVKEKLG